MPRKRKAGHAPSESSQPDRRGRSNEIDPPPVSNTQPAPDPANDSRNNMHRLPGRQAPASLFESQPTHAEQGQHDTVLLQSILHQLSGSLNNNSVNADQSHSSSHSSHPSSSSTNNPPILESFAQNNYPVTQTASLLPLLQILMEGNQTRPWHTETSPAASSMPQETSAPDSTYLLLALQLLGMMQNHPGQPANYEHSTNSFAAHAQDQGYANQESSNPSAIEPGSTRTSNVTRKTSHEPFPLYMSCDDQMLSAYQCMIRKHIELFAASKEDICTIGQGRNRRVQVGQVGVRCMYCRHIPQLAKTKGAVYFPFKIDNVYQASQNLGAVHLCDNCPNIPPSTKAELQRLAKEPKSTAGGGKKYWSEGVRVAGIVEDEEGRLSFRDE